MGPAGLAGLRGQGRIRTFDTVAGVPVFETGAIDHSATCPKRDSWHGGKVWNRHAKSPVNGEPLSGVWLKGAHADYGSPACAPRAAGRSRTCVCPVGPLMPCELRQRVPCQKRKRPGRLESSPNAPLAGARHVPARWFQRHGVGKIMPAGHGKGRINKKIHAHAGLADGAGFEPARRLQSTPLAEECLRPLGQPSGKVHCSVINMPANRPLRVASLRAPGRGRTCTMRFLQPLPLPVGLPEQGGACRPGMGKAFTDWVKERGAPRCGVREVRTRV